MADGLIDIIQPRLPKMKKINKKSKEYQWMKIYDMREELKGHLNIESQCYNIKGNSLLEVIGTKLNLKTDKRIDKEFGIIKASEVFNRNIR